jgi:uncharacterized peroxidase-related enzyme
MARFDIPTRDTAPEAAKPILDVVKSRIGFVPGTFRLLAISPAALSAFSAFQTALSKTLDLKTRDGIALAVSQVNGCNYCLSAHTYASTNFAKMSPEEIALCRSGTSSDPKRAAAVAYAKKFVETRGRVSDEDMAAVRTAGWTDAELIEIMLVSVQFLLTNFLNSAADTPIDFPAVEPAETVAA